MMAALVVAAAFCFIQRPSVRLSFPHCRYFNADRPLQLLQDERDRVEKVEDDLDLQLEMKRLERLVYEVRECVWLCGWLCG